MDISGCAWDWGRGWERDSLWLCCWESMTQKLGLLLSFPLTLLPPLFFLSWVLLGLRLQHELEGNAIQFIATPNSFSQLYAFVTWFPLLGCPFHSSPSWEVLFTTQISIQMLTPPRHRASIASFLLHERDPLPSSCSPRACDHIPYVAVSREVSGSSFIPTTTPTLLLQGAVCEVHGDIQYVSHTSS